MKQYRYNSESFVSQGETGDADAFIDPAELGELRRLAGLPPLLETTPVPGGAGTVGGNLDIVPNITDDGIQSPVGSNISFTAQERNNLMKEFHAQPGTDLWFIINFTKPYLNGSLRSKVEEYLKQHPEYRPRSFPNND
jgi:hypothetical protein